MDKVLTSEVSLTASSYDATRATALFDELSARVGTHPAVESMAYSIGWFGTLVARHEHIAGIPFPGRVARCSDTCGCCRGDSWAALMVALRPTLRGGRLNVARVLRLD